MCKVILFSVVKCECKEYIYIYIIVNARKLEKVGVIFFPSNTRSPPQLSTSLIWFAAQKSSPFLIFLAASEVQQLLSPFSIPLSFFLFPSSPLLTRQPSLSHQNKISLSKEEIKGLRLKFQLQIVGGKKSKLYLFISTSLTSILIL